MDPTKRSASLKEKGRILLAEKDTFFDNIRGQERFKKLMERVKYEWEHFEE